MRSFVALSLPEDLSARLAARIAGFPAGRVVAPENLHITLAFLGDQTDLVLEELHHGLGSIFLPAFEVKIDGFGSFGGSQPRALYAAVTPSPSMSTLHKAVRRAARIAGIDLPHERFVPHITLARFRPVEAGAASSAMAKLMVEGFTARFEPAAFTLFGSNLTPEGPRYEVLADYPLFAAD